MATQKQIEANRRNSLLSTGPRTPAGKAVSRGNAMQSGIYAESLAIRGEDPRGLQTLAAEYVREFHPVTARERDLVDSIVRNEWILRRMGLVEAELWNHYFQTTDVTLPGSRFDVLDRHFFLAQGFNAIGATLERLQRRISAVERSTRRAQAELAELRAARERGDLPEADPDDALEPADPELPLTETTEGSSPRIGFVPSIPRHVPLEEYTKPSLEPCSPAAPVPDPRPSAPSVALAS